VPGSVLGEYGYHVIDCVRSGAVYGSGDRAYELVTNTWIIGDPTSVLVIDPANDPDAILAAIDGCHVVAVLCTNGTVDHVNAAPAVADATNAPVLLHSADARFWAGTNPGRTLDGELIDGQVLTVAGIDLHVLHTPGYTRGSCSFHVPTASTVFSGDTLGVTAPEPGSPFSDAVTQLASIRAKLLPLPPHTEVRRAHGDVTAIADHLDQG
jgi:glyoxylase-like metal-dependent hydrolase (beta-lactamase superfamily II)